MSQIITPDFRDSLASAFRERILERIDIVPFPHQRAWMCASDGQLLLDVQDPSGKAVRLPDGSVQTWMVAPRPEGRARFLALLSAYKGGKSFSAALWAAGFACIPDRRITLIGLEYSITEPEFSYIIDFLLSERGMNMKATRVSNRPTAGDMFLELKNGTRFEAKSWERKDSLKGREIDAYIACESYQLPGIESFTSVQQNLRARRGFYVWPTTPDRPWLKELHARGHGLDPDFHCTCGVSAEANPVTFDAKEKERSRDIMTREQFAIAYEGKLGDFVGRVFNYQRGQRTFTPSSHPELWIDPEGKATPDNLQVPPGWEIVGGADTGSYYSAGLIAFSPTGDAFILEEFPNYRYLAGTIERDEDITIPEWANKITSRTLQLGGKPRYWADANSQFKHELGNYGVTLLPDKEKRETRTEVAREYFQHNRVYLAPWLTVIPFELENAAWPPEATTGGKFERMKDRDHSLDWVEHILVQRPIGRIIVEVTQRRSFADTAGWRSKSHQGNVHIGRN